MNNRKTGRSCLPALSLVAAAIPAVATAAEDGSGQEQDQELEEVIVTGSRLTRAADEMPNPVLTVQAEDLRQSGYTNLTDALVQIPALVASQTRFDNSGARAGIGTAGLNLLDLRNLGTDRTLVLVNGRRHVGGVPGSAAVDLNSIPIDLIERVDVLTGGVSAIYGADGVSGVVNFITRRDFEGLIIRGQGGLSELGDGGNRFFSLTRGDNFADGRANLTLSYEYSADGRVRETGRPRAGDPLRSWSMQRNPGDFPDDPDVYDRIPLNDLRYANTAAGGAFNTDWVLDEETGGFRANFNGTGTPFDQGLLLPSTGLVQGGDSTPVAGYSGDLQAESRRHSANLFSSYQLNDSVRLFAEGKYVNTRTWNQSQPSFDFYTFVSAENPFMPDSMRDAIDEDAAADWGMPAGVLMNRDNFDLGRRQDDATRQTLRSVVGIDGTLGAGGPRYEISYTFGQSRIRNVDVGTRVEERYFAALDAVDEGQFLTGTPSGNVVCRIDLQPAGTAVNEDNINWESFIPSGDGSGVPVTFTPGANSGCMPFNPFGDGVANAASIDFIRLDAVTKTRLSQHVVSATLSGDFYRFFTLPAGDVQWAAGLEYRKEKSRSNPDELIQQELLWGYPLILPDSGSFDVREAFFEVGIPLLRNAPLAHSLDIGGAVRLSDYSTVGKTTTWKVDARWAPVRDLAFRGTWSEAVRAPNIGELFSPVSGTFEFVDDPCDPLYIAEGSEFREVNCTALLTGLGVDPATFNPSSDPEATTNLPGSLAGNPELQEETAKSWTAGFVLRPAALPDLMLSFDWYNVKLKNAVAIATAQELVDLCVDQPTLDNSFCDGIERNAGTGYVEGFMMMPRNVARFTTAGADLTVRYAFAPLPDMGRFEWKLAGGYLDELTFIATPGAEVSDERMDSYAPKYTASTDLTWRRASWAVNYGVNYFSKTRRFSEDQKRANPDIADPRYFNYGAKWVHDVQAAYTVPTNGLEVYLGVNNLYDRKPSFPGANYPVGFMGRYIYGGARFELGR
ncbi:MAG TPA: TonB-dependent receptor [Steroidobacteraceae bacterium]|nr:TonB-dependent receptor [Steroidobacteraceae bacterium]